MMNFGQQIREQRKRLGLTQAAVVYSECVAPFFLGISTKIYNRLGHRPDQRLSLLWKGWLVVIVVLVISGLLLSQVLIIRQYFFQRY
ncbi:hypothetical protein KZE55_09715 [Limosilactobacillus panis]|uniref:hypothetical protein n=1 Tax=Limosilactobacillus panis TaxID=47493 RepID=UPI001C9592E2|nr:hypothetical protein [Limosilactobacillus panis]QZN92998.1 hypothetical protein KZE55_09715 [Limosilactobacillus panis]